MSSNKAPSVAFVAAVINAAGGLAFVLTCTIISFVANVEFSNHGCLEVWMDEVRGLRTGFQQVVDVVVDLGDAVATVDVTDGDSDALRKLMETQMAKAIEGVEGAAAAAAAGEGTTSNVEALQKLDAVVATKQIEDLLVEDMRKVLLQVSGGNEGGNPAISLDILTDSLGAGVKMFQSWDRRLTSASIVSDCLAAFGIIYGAIIFLNAVLTLITLCFSAHWHVSKVIKHQAQIHAVGSVLALILLILTCVYCYFLDINVLLMDGIQMASVMGVDMAKWDGAEDDVACIRNLNGLQSRWSPLIVFITIVLTCMHAYVARTAHLFHTSTSARTATLDDDESHATSAAPETNNNNVAGNLKFVGVRNLLVGGTDGGDGGNRTRLPSSRHYPSSPILPNYPNGQAANGSNAPAPF